MCLLVARGIDQTSPAGAARQRCCGPLPAHYRSASWHNLPVPCSTRPEPAHCVACPSKSALDWL
ncbi:hypothetical protein RU08_17935 [Pseudomonas fulva]|uniref:Uncharacterized protein n=1 Tax=Pseudomonas fulva TaxID=47880 RepID=A0A0D0KI66_9PSED|nr:hypothetical protein RU08_17935 [Pseudomonas fulva]